MPEIIENYRVNYVGLVTQLNVQTSRRHYLINIAFGAPGCLMEVSDADWLILPNMKDCRRMGIDFFIWKKKNILCDTKRKKLSDLWEM